MAIDFDDRVEVVGHDDPGSEGDFLADLFGFSPFLGDDLAPWVEVHDAVGYFSKEVLALVGAEGDEVNTGVRIVVVFESNRSTMVFVNIEGHSRKFGICRPYNSPQ